MAESQADFREFFFLPQFLNQAKQIPVQNQNQPCLPVVVL